MIFVSNYFNHQDCIDLINKEILINKGFLDGVNLKTYLEKIDEKCEWYKHYYNNELVGFIAFYCNDTYSKKAFITLVLVDSKMRGKGVAKDMLINVLEIVRLEGFVECSLEVNVNNLAAYKLYCKHGFIKDKSNSFDSYLMTKKIV